MSTKAISMLDTLNSLEQQPFATKLAEIVEHSPWVAEKAWAARPFASLDALVEAFSHALEAASDSDKIAVLRLHPELVHDEPETLTDSSQSEQSSSGLLAMATDARASLGQLLSQYRERYDFPFVLCVSGRNPDEIRAEVKRRLDSTPEAELSTAIGEVKQIAALRLRLVVQGGA